MLQLRWTDKVRKEMVPIYNTSGTEKLGESLVEDYQSDAYIGIVRIHCTNSKKYKDGSYLFHICLSAHSQESTTHYITLAKVRGNLDTTKAKAEEILAGLNP